MRIALLSVLVILIIAWVAIIALSATGTGWFDTEPTPTPTATPTPTPSPTPTPTPTPTCEPGLICVTAAQLCDDYDTNKLAADNKYKGKPIEIYGEVKEIDRDSITGRPYITLDCGLLLNIDRVWCYFNKADEAELEQLEKGDWVYVWGEGASTTLAGHPKLEQCTLDRESIPTPTPTPICEPGVICVTAAQLCSDYRGNVTAADDKYNGQTLQVSGEVKEIDRDSIIGRSYITLDCGLLLNIDRVWCYFKKAGEAELEQLEKGDWVYVWGEGASTTLAGHPKLEQCTLDRE
jgi:gamma-glutamylcyclotransferase (GGCT)/AIG2-like uncharacterized protein YtfP